MEMNVLYRGFVKTKGKEPVSKFKDVPDQALLSEDAAAVLPEYAGVLARDIVLIDVDDQEMSDVMFQIIQDQKIRCHVYKTTRGKHFLFRNCDEEGRYFIEKQLHNANLACGLAADVKAGCNNGIEVLKYDGKDREVLLDPSSLDPLPFIFWPVKDAKCDLWKMKDGDGRNAALFEYEISCVKAGLTIKQIRELFQTINEYILEEKLEEKELQTIVRDDAFKDILVQKNKLNLPFLSELMITEDKVVKMDNQIFIYQAASGCYSSDLDIIERRMLDYIPTLNQHQRNEVLNYFRVKAPVKEPADKRYIMFRNCVYDVENDELKEFSPTYIIPNQIPWNYAPEKMSDDSYGNRMENALYKWCCYDEEILDLLEEMIGYCMYRENTFRKFFVLVGNHMNGKSKFLKLIMKLVGRDNTSIVALEKIDTKFHDSLLYRKLVNIGDDIDDGYISHTATLKKLVSGDPVTGENKGQRPFSYICYATLVFSANNIPKIRDDTGAVKNRMVIIPFNAQFEEGSADNNPNILEEIVDDEGMEYLIWRGIEGLKRLLKNKHFTIPEKVKEAMSEYQMDSDPVAAFLEQAESVNNRPTDEVFFDFRKYCIAHDVRMKEISHTRFTQLVKKKTGCKTGVRKIEGISKNCYLFDSN